MILNKICPHCGHPEADHDWEREDFAWCSGAGGDCHCWGTGGPLDEDYVPDPVMDNPMVKELRETAERYRRNLAFGSRAPKTPGGGPDA